MHIDTTYYDPHDRYRCYQTRATKYQSLILESPSSLTMEVPDIPAIVKAVRNREPEIVIMIDNTWAGAYYSKR